jgi:hypothetical protein
MPNHRPEDTALWQVVGSESVLIDPFLRFSQGVRVGFISSPENGIELILM